MWSVGKRHGLQVVTLREDIPSSTNSPQISPPFSVEKGPHRRAWGSLRLVELAVVLVTYLISLQDEFHVSCNGRQQQVDVELPHKATSEAIGFCASFPSVAADHLVTT